MAIVITIGPHKQFHIAISGDEEAEEEGSESPPILRAELQVPPAIVDRYEAYQQQNDRREKLRTTIESLTLLAILGTLIVTGISTGAAVRSTDTAVKTLEETQRSSRLDQRAWVGVDHQPKTVEIVPDTDMAFKVVVRNSGKTPAINVTSSVTYRGVDRGQPFTPHYQKGEENGSVLVIQPNAAIEVRTAKVRLPPDLVRQLTEEQGAIYVYGQVGYDDIFGYSHCTAFCLFYEGDPKQAKFCTSHNYVTDTKCQQ